MSALTIPRSPALAEMHPVTLRFGSAELEAAWRAERARRALRPFRATTGLAIALYLGFIVLDQTFLEDMAGRLLVVRGFGCAILPGIPALAGAPAWPRFTRGILAAAVRGPGGGR